MSKLAAAALVFLCSAAVLMLEILAGRLLAPYVGISLETYTSIIGTVLAGIAAGAWAGGKLADRFNPRRLLGPTVCLGGVLALFTVPIVRAALGDQSGTAGRGPTLLLTFAGFFLPAVVLSAVTPMVVKLQLHDLHRTGGVVGRLSGISTSGALVGTFVTGYLLTATIPTSNTIFALGTTLIVVGVILKVGRERLGLRTSPALQVRIGDARIGIRTRPDHSADLVVGDAFASLSVPWHLTTVEFAREIHRVLRPDGIYIMNIIDYPNFRFVRSELATLRKEFSWVGAISPDFTVSDGGNVVLVASDHRPFRDAYHSNVIGNELLEGAALERFVVSAPVIRDDFAPIDQWLNADKP